MPDRSITIGERLRMLTTRYGSWRHAARIMISEATEGSRNETGWAVVASVAGRGIPEDVVWQLFEKHKSNGQAEAAEAQYWDALADDEFERYERKQRFIDHSVLRVKPVSGSGPSRARACQELLWYWRGSSSRPQFAATPAAPPRHC
jgi:hypothetical protein